MKVDKTIFMEFNPLKALETFLWDINLLKYLKSLKIL